jgi:hypothetical protein
MKLSALVTIISAAQALAAFGWSGNSNEQVSLAEEFNVPGENPLLFCEDPKKNILVIEKVDLDPNPPEA